MKKWVIIVAVVLAGIFLVKTTHMASYGRIMFEKARAGLQRSIPREVEIERVRNEIARLDNDIRKLLRPIAEKMTTIEQTEKDVQSTEAKLTTQREQLVRLTEEVASNNERVSYGRQNLSLVQAKKRLNTDVSLYETRKANLESKKRRLEAQRTSVAATQEQLTALMEQKRELSNRLEEVIANEEINKLNEIARPLPFNKGRVADITNTLNRLEREQSIDAKERILVEQWEPKLNENAQTTPAVTTQPIDFNRIRNVLGVQTPGEPSKVAVSGSNP